MLGRFITKSALSSARHRPLMSVAPTSRQPALIGSHSVTQVAWVLRDRLSESFADATLADATRYTLSTLPSGMIDEREPQALLRALVYRLGAVQATSVLREAGVRTARQLLAENIPAFVHVATRVLPRRTACSMLLRRMRASAWRFAGSGHFDVEPSAHGPEMVFSNCAMCRDMHAAQAMCAFYAGTFEHLFCQLVSSRARVVETVCMAEGASDCRFRLLGI